MAPKHARVHTSAHRTPRRRWFGAVAVLSLVAAGLGVGPALADHGDVSLPGSMFEIEENANLKVDHGPPSLDWANVNEDREADAPTGKNDDSYAGGAKEDDACPGTTTGSIPPNKSDLLNFGVYVEDGDPGFLHLFWHRVQEPSGTTLMDFEFNQSSTDCGNGVNPVRTAGDLLIEYRIEQGGARANILVREWTGSAWGPATDFTDSGAVGTINQSAISESDSDGLGSISPRTFGEASIDLNLIFDDESCKSFGSAFLKSRASTSFTSQLKDFIAPVPIDLTNCGKVIIRKETDPPDSPQFGFTKSFNTDPATSNTFNLAGGGSRTFDNVLFGTGYTVTEDTLPANWALVEVDCSAGNVDPTSIVGATVTFDIADEGDVLDCTYKNKLQVGALKILKNSTKGTAVSNAGAVFTYERSGVTENVTDNGAGDDDPTVGVICVSGLLTGDYTVNETSPPDGYGDATQSNLTATVVAGTNCTENQPTGTGSVTFVNAPLADIQVNFRDGGSGETEIVSMDCTNTGTTADTTVAPGWDDSVTHEGIEIDPSPRTVTCTIVIDP